MPVSTKPPSPFATSTSSTSRPPPPGPPRSGLYSRRVEDSELTGITGDHGDRTTRDTETNLLDELVLPGAMLGDYRIERPLGRGAMGVVYEAAHPLIGKRAAIK